MDDINERDLIPRSGPTVPQKMSEGADFFSMIERLSSSPDIPVEKIQQLMDMQERILDRNSKQAFNASMVDAQSKIKMVVARQKNAQTKSNYANLKSILVEAAPIYTASGFSLMFYEGDTSKEDHKRVCVDIMHIDGHTETRHGDFAIQTTGIGGKKMMTQIHGEGSAFMYGRRYMTCMIFNIPTGDDDDGNAAGGGPVLSDNQAEKINTLLKSLNFGEDRKKIFLGYAGADKVENILAKSFSKVWNELKRAEAVEKKAKGKNE